MATSMILVVTSLGLAKGERPEAEEGSTSAPNLSLETIFSSTEWNAKGAPAYQWRAARPGCTRLKEASGKRPGKDLVWIKPKTNEEEILVPSHVFIPPEENAPLGIDSYRFSSDGSKLLLFTNSKQVWRTKSRGDYWVLDIAARTLRRLGGDAPPSSLQFASFAPNSKKVAYVHDNDLYVQDLRTMEIQRLTDDGSDNIINGTFDWVYEEEFRVRKGYRWSPDSESIAFWQIDTRDVKRFHLINNTDGLYPEIFSYPYPKVGERNPGAQVGVVELQNGETTWLDIPGDPRRHYIPDMTWSEHSQQIILQQLNRPQTTNRVMLAQPESGNTELLFTESDKAWIDHQAKLWWLNKGKGFVWLSERNGWRHAYRFDLKSRDLTPITKGDFDVISIEGIDEEHNRLYLIASPTDPTQRYLYRAPLNGGKLDRVTPTREEGFHSYDLSPKARWAVHSFSTFTSPPTHELIKLRGHESIRGLEDNQTLRKRLDKLNKPKSEFFRVPIDGGRVALDGWTIKPPDFCRDREYPVLFYVYGGPAGQTVLDRWAGKRRLWHWMLAQKGYCIISLDNRGTPAPRGREWRKSVSGKLGILSSADQAAATKALLKERRYIDQNRVAVWGWSGGGSMTLNLLFRYPEIYQTGMAIAPVPNLRLYDSIYMERYMGLPSDNPEGYRRGSPITYADQLKGNLLLVHGTGDDNVHYQGTQNLINELVLHNKSFSMMAYPNRRHGIAEGHNTRRHLFQMMTQFLKEHLSSDAAAAAP